MSRKSKYLFFSSLIYPGYSRPSDRRRVGPGIKLAVSLIHKLLFFLFFSSLILVKHFGTGEINKIYKIPGSQENKNTETSSISSTSGRGAGVSYHDHSTRDFGPQMKQISFIHTFVHIFCQDQFPIQSNPVNTCPRPKHKYPDISKDI